jgi:hypothetical protein
MKPRQLANVLIKVAGLYICVSNIPGLVYGIFAVYMQDALRPNGSEMGFGILSYVGSAIIGLVLGILLIVKSQKLAAFWFKNDEE